MALNVGSDLLPGTPDPPAGHILVHSPILNKSDAENIAVSLSENHALKNETRFGYPFDLTDLDFAVAAKFGADSVITPSHIDPGLRYIYILRCENQKYFINDSSGFLASLHRHFSGKDCSFTKKNPPSSVINVVQIPLTMMFYNRKKIFLDMIRVCKKQFGKDNVGKSRRFFF